MPLRVVLAEDHHVVRQGLEALLRTEPDMQLVGEAATGLDALRLVEKLEPDVLVLDLMMPGLGGLEVAHRVAERHPHTKVVILSMHQNEAYVVAAFRAGATGYVVKESTSAELIRAIREAAAGRRYFSPPLSESIIADYLRKADDKTFDPYDTLTSREREVLQMAAEGLTNSEIAAQLFISARTVESHRANLMRKLNLRSQSELIRYAVRKGIVSLGE
jgi:two-component system response regulator NreC